MENKTIIDILEKSISIYEEKYLNNTGSIDSFKRIIKKNTPIQMYNTIKYNIHNLKFEVSINKWVCPINNITMRYITDILNDKYNFKPYKIVNNKNKKSNDNIFSFDFSKLDKYKFEV